MERGDLATLIQAQVALVELATRSLPGRRRGGADSANALKCWSLNTR